MTIEETVKSFIEDVNAEFGSDLAIDEGEEGEIAINWPGHGHRGLLSLKRADFERAAKSIQPDFVTITAVPQATIARKLETV